MAAAANKILQARLQQYVNHELPDVQARFRKGRETRDQIANTGPAGYDSLLGRPGQAPSAQAGPERGDGGTQTPTFQVP